MEIAILKKALKKTISARYERAFKEYKEKNPTVAYFLENTDEGMKLLSGGKQALNDEIEKYMKQLFEVFGINDEAVQKSSLVDMVEQLLEVVGVNGKNAKNDHLVERLVNGIFFNEPKEWVEEVLSIMEARRKASNQQTFEYTAEPQKRMVTLETQVADTHISGLNKRIEALQKECTDKLKILHRMRHDREMEEKERVRLCEKLIKIEEENTSKKDSDFHVSSSEPHGSFREIITLHTRILTLQEEVLASSQIKTDLQTSIQPDVLANRLDERNQDTDAWIKKYRDYLNTGLSSRIPDVTQKRWRGAAGVYLMDSVLAMKMLPLDIKNANAFTEDDPQLLEHINSPRVRDGHSKPELTDMNANANDYGLVEYVVPHVRLVYLQTKESYSEEKAEHIMLLLKECGICTELENLRVIRDDKREDEREDEAPATSSKINIMPNEGETIFHVLQKFSQDEKRIKQGLKTIEQTKYYDNSVVPFPTPEGSPNAVRSHTPKEKDTGAPDVLSGVFDTLTCLSNCLQEVPRSNRLQKGPLSKTHQVTPSVRMWDVKTSPTLLRRAKSQVFGIQKKEPELKAKIRNADVIIDGCIMELCETALQCLEGNDANACFIRLEKSPVTGILVKRAKTILKDKMAEHGDALAFVSRIAGGKAEPSELINDFDAVHRFFKTLVEVFPVPVKINDGPLRKASQ